MLLKSSQLRGGLFPAERGGLFERKIQTGLAADFALPYSYANAMLLRIDETGEATELKETNGLEYGIFLNNLIATQQGGFAFTGYVIDTVPTLAFGRFYPDNDSLIVLKYKTTDTYVYLGNTLLQATDNFFYIAGLKTNNSNGNGNVCLVKIDTSGNKIWEKFYDQYKLDDARSIIQLTNGNLLLGAVRNNLNQTNEHANTWLLEVDTGGNIVRQWFDPSDSTYVAEGLLQTNDGGFIYGAQKKYLQTINSVYKVATVVKTDNNFNKQWVFTDGNYNTETALVDLEELPDGGFIGCGNKPFYNGDSSMISGWVVKLDANGNVVWNRTYVGFTTSQSYNYLTDIDILPDGGLIAVGQCQLSGATPPQVGWFLKLDSNGCEIENCLVGIEEIEKQKPQINIYPNPTQSSFKVKLPDDMQGAIVRMYDVTGVLVTKTRSVYENETWIDVSDLSSGMYLIIATKGEKMVRGKLIVE